MDPSPFANIPLWRRAAAELLGTGLLVTIVVGSGIAAQRLSPNDIGLQLLESSLTTALGLSVLILLFSPLSGAHLNPAITLAATVLARRDRGAATELASYLGAQLTGAIGGCLLANAMFDVETSISARDRVSGGTLLGEVIATAGLVVLVFALIRSARPGLVAPAVGAYIGAAYWFTPSTGFANPAATVGRMLTDSFAGIAPGSAMWFIAAQLVGAAAGTGLVMMLYSKRERTRTT